MGTLRTTLALSVVFVHLSLGRWLVGGTIAVQMFYCVSGFLITYVLASGQSYKAKLPFYLNRALRVYPVYYTVAAIALIADLMRGTSVIRTFSVVPLLGRLTLGLVNITVFGQDWVMFLALHSGKIHFTTNFAASDVLLYDGLLIMQAWTLGVELSFYALAPFIVTRLNRIWIVLAISVAVRVVLVIMGLAFKDPWTYRFFPAEMMWFMLGALSMHLLLPKCQKLLDKKPRWTASCVGFILALFVLYPVLPGRDIVKHMALMGLIVVFLPAMFVFQNQSAWDKRIGDLSYPIYICHMLIIESSAVVLHRFFAHQFYLIAMIQVGAVIIMAYCLDRFVANPVERLRKRFRRPLPASNRRLVTDAQ